MLLKYKLIIALSAALLAFLYGFYLTSYLVSLTFSGDLIKYRSLWDSLQQLEINKYSKLCCNKDSMTFISAATIGSYQFIYPLIVNLFSKIINFESFISISAGIYSSLLTFVFLFQKKFFLRFIFLIPLLFNIYAFGLFSVLDRLKIALIVYLITFIPIVNSKLKNILLFTSVLIHSSIFLIALPTFVNINASLKIKSKTKNLYKIYFPKILNFKVKKFFIKLIYFSLFSSFLLLIYYLTSDKFTSWIPFIIKYLLSFDIVNLARRLLETFFVFILMFPNFEKKKKPNQIHFLSILPIVLVTFLIGSFRTLILAFVYFAISNWRLDKKTFFSYLQSLFFIVIMINSIYNGFNFIEKLQFTGFGF